MYVKVKRQKTTIFLMVEATDTIMVVKQKLDDLIQKVSGTKPSCNPRRYLNYIG